MGTLVSLTDPALCEIIGKEAFFESGLTSIYLFDTIKTVGENAFGNCAALKNIRISPYIGTGLDANAFAGCENITDAELLVGALEYINLAKVKNLTINDYDFDEDKEGATLDLSLFEDATSLKTLTLGRGVTEMVNAEGFDATGIKFEVDRNNPVFEVVGGVIVLRSDKTQALPVVTEE